jgi:predicted O-methyltransferase YrrM
MAQLPATLRHWTPNRLRDEVHLRAVAVGLGLIPPRTMHSADDARLLLEVAQDAHRVVEIGVYEGSSAVALCEALPAGSELHLVDPFGEHPDALPGGWAGTEWATRRVVGRALRRRATPGPSVHWHAALSHEVAARWSGPVDMIFVDGDHTEGGCERDWDCWHEHVAVGGHVVFHDARMGRPGGRGLPGPTAVVDRHFRSPDAHGPWEIAAEADRTVAVRRRA